MSDAGQRKPRALGRGLDDIIRPPDPSPEDVDATGNLLSRMKPRHVRPGEPVQPANPFAPQTPPQPEPVRPPNPSADQTGSPTEPVPAANPTPLPERTGSPAEPVRVTEGFMTVTNHLLDDVLPALEPHVQVVLLRLYRLTRGHRKARCKVSKNKLIAKTHVKRTRLLEALALLEERGYIKRLPDDISSGDVYDRGMNIEMLLPGVEPVRPANPSGPRTGSQRGPNKREEFKQQDVNPPAPSAEDLEEYERARKELEGK